MFKYGLLLFLLIVSAFAPWYSIAPLQVKSAKKQGPQKKTTTTSKKNTTASKKVTPKRDRTLLQKSQRPQLRKRGSTEKRPPQKIK